VWVSGGSPYGLTDGFYRPTWGERKRNHAPATNLSEPA
jgi:hypothetical protein